MSLCRFFLRGWCRQGTACEYVHVLDRETSPETADLETRSTELQGEAQEEPLTSRSQSCPPVCRYFLQDTCRNSDLCRLMHPAPDSQLSGARSRGVDLPADLTSTKKDTPSTSTQTMDSEPSQTQRQLDGALVTFGPGAEVTNIDFPDLQPTYSRTSVPPHMATPPSCTVMCTWYQASCVAYLHYTSYERAMSAQGTLRGELDLHSRKRACAIRPPPQYQGYDTPSLWVLEVGNMSPDTTEQDLQDILHSNRPERIFFSAATPQTEISYECALEFITTLLKGTNCRVESLEMVPANISQRVRALARFAAPTDIALAFPLGGRYYPQLRSTLYFEQVVTVTIPTLPEIVYTLRDLIAAEWRRSAKAVRSWIRYGSPAKAALVICGAKPQAVAILKVSLERLLAGTVIAADPRGPVPLWNDFFATEAGLSYLNSLSRARLLFVRRDLRLRQLVLYGAESLYEQTRLGILETLLQHSQAVHYMTLNKDLWTKALAGGFGRVVGALGRDKVKLVRTEAKSYLQVHGPPRDMDTIHKILAQHCVPGSSLPASSSLLLSSSLSPECPACLTTPETPVRLSCGHQYCRDCLAAQCQDGALEAFGVPVVCLGNAGTCRKVVSLAELRGVLGVVAFEALLLSSVRLFVRLGLGRGLGLGLGLGLGRAQVRYCPTPDCPTLVPVREDGAVVTCSGCRAVVCTACQTVSHEELTCEEARALRARLAL